MRGDPPVGVVLDACMVITFGTQRRLDVVAPLGARLLRDPQVRTAIEDLGRLRR